MTRLIAVALVLAVLGWTVPARAVIGTVDQVPAATLLLPYFEVDLDNPNGVATLMSINNASSQAVLAHVVLWTNLSVPTFTFNVYLTGYDVQTINLRDIFVNGVLPQTASAAQDPGDAISPNGEFSGADVTFPNCQNQLPPPSFAQVLAAHGGNPAFDYKTHLQRAHTGKSSAVLGNKCAAGNFPDRIARGYITVDTVNSCTLKFPSDAGYFVTGGVGDATNQNVLWGDYFYVNPGENFAQGETLVHIEAAPGTGTSASWGTYTPDPETTVAGQYTFYGRYVNWTAADNREPLATNFAVRYLAGGAFTGGTDLIVWRDSKVKQDPFTCVVNGGTRPAWIPLGQEAVVIFDEQENASLPPSVPFGPPPALPGLLPFPIEAQRTQMNSSLLPVPFNFGWLYLNLNVSVPLAGNNPPEDPTASQAWVTVVHDAEGRFSVGYTATQLDSATKAIHFSPGP
jgi:hypothetical protein